MLFIQPTGAFVNIGLGTGPRTEGVKTFRMRKKSEGKKSRKRRGRRRRRRGGGGGGERARERERERKKKHLAILPFLFQRPLLPFGHGLLSLVGHKREENVGTRRNQQWKGVLRKRQKFNWPALILFQFSSFSLSLSLSLSLAFLLLYVCVWLVTGPKCLRFAEKISGRSFIMCVRIKLNDSE